MLSIVNRIFQPVQNFAEGVVDWVQDNITDPVGEAFSDIGEAVVDTISNAAGFVREGIEDAGEFIGDVGMRAVNVGGQLFLQVASKAGEAIGDITGMDPKGPDLSEITLEEALEGQIYGDLAALAYDDEGDGRFSSHKRLGAEELAALGFEPGELVDAETELESFIFHDAEADEYVLAFRGSELDLTDWMGNFDQGTGGVPPQYRQAMDIAEKLQAAVGDKFVATTGNSLGGGLAHAAALKTGVEGFGYNAAGLNVGVINEIGFGKVIANAQNLTHFNVVGEPLTDPTGGQDRLSFGGVLLGDVNYMLPGDAGDDPISRHLPHGYMPALEQVVQNGGQQAEPSGWA